MRMRSVRQLKGARWPRPQQAAGTVEPGHAVGLDPAAHPHQLKGGWRPVTPLSSHISFLSMSAPSTLSPPAIETLNLDGT